MRAILFAAVVVGIASAADHKFAIGEPASCVVDASGRTIVRYISEVHTSFQCTHTSAGACTGTRALDEWSKWSVSGAAASILWLARVGSKRL